MLIKCPECELQVSDKAVSCPHCGYPMTSNISRPRRKTNRRCRLPNGFGQISELKGRNLRKPFRVMITVGKTEEGKPISRLLEPDAYFETYNDAYMALLKYNKDPYDPDKNMTVKELYDKWFEDCVKDRCSQSRIRGLQSAWNYCSDIHGMKVRDIKAKHIRYCMENGKCIINKKEQSPSGNVQVFIKSLFNMMLDYAVSYDIVDSNCAKNFAIPNKITKEKQEKHKSHINFTDEEMKVLWDNMYADYIIQIIIIDCYSGWRPSELLDLKTSDIDWNNDTMIGGKKTKAGKDRIVPIHPKIKRFLREKYDLAVDNESKYIFLHNGKRMSYNYYRLQFDDAIKRFKLNSAHKPHDCRVQFVSMAKKYNVDDYAIKYIVGHAIQDITEKVYTRRDIEWLCNEMNKIEAV